MSVRHKSNVPPRSSRVAAPTGVGRGHVEIHALQRDAEQLADVRLVVDNERPRFRHEISQR
jgi:hypothetical protein